MTILQTTSCQRHGHPEIRITYDPALVPVEDDARWFMSWLEEAVASGEQFTVEQTVQVGWMILLVRALEDGVLSLWEPDMRDMPIAWVESVSRTLAYLRLQKDVCESLLEVEDIAFPSLEQTAIICKRVGQTKGVFMERLVPSSRLDSGWFYGCTCEDHDHNNTDELRCVSLYELGVKVAPHVVQYLALPEGALIQLGQGKLSIFRHGVPLAIRAGSYLAALNGE
jgi:hypothetical protein